MPRLKYRKTLYHSTALAEVYRAIDRAEEKRKGVMVPARWLRKVLQERLLLARLGADEPQFDEIRDRILQEEVA